MSDWDFGGGDKITRENEPDGAWKIQASVKIGDHMINVRGMTVAEVKANIRELVAEVQGLHQAFSALDGGRSATEVVPKPSSAYGARGQGHYRSSGGQGNGKNFSQKTSSGGGGKPKKLMVGVPTGQKCGIHGADILRVPGGTSKTGSEYNASLQCADVNHRDVLEWLDGET